MKLFKKIRKGFTLIELVVVIAVIAILSAVSIVSYVSITQKAKQSNDQQKVEQANLALASAEVDGKPKTMAEALAAIEEDGFLPEKFKAEAKNYEFGYAMEENRIVIIEKENKVVYPKDYQQGPSANIWRFASENGDVGEGAFSYYLLDGCSGSITNKAKGGVDVGKNKDITAFTIESTQEKLVVNSGGDQCVVTIDAASSDVDYYGFAKRIVVKHVKGSSLHIYGSVGVLKLESGHAQVESTGIIFDVARLGDLPDCDGASITNNGYIASASLVDHRVDPEDPTSALPAAVEEGAEEQMKGKDVSKNFEIATLAQLESFRDAVNAGNNFKGLTVKLVKDITLEDGWQPIGEGYRDVGASDTQAYGITTFFAGVFDGQGHIISNLNNKKFVPTKARLVKDGESDTYAYGLFALVENAEIKNIRFTSVDIDESRYTSANMDSVGAAVGYSKGSLVLDNIEVGGSIKGHDAAGGVLGRAYFKSTDTTTDKIIVKDCKNSANITVATEKSCKGAGIVGFISNIDKFETVSVSGNANTGTISGGAAYSGTDHTTYVAGGVGKYVLRAGVAIVQSAFTDAMHSDNTNNGGAATLVGSASGIKLLG